MCEWAVIIKSMIQSLSESIDKRNPNDKLELSGDN